MKGPIQAVTESITQPDIANTGKGQKRFRVGDEYDPVKINSELDYVHQRLNGVVTEDPAVADLDSAAVLADVIVRLNTITETLRKAGLLRRE